MFIFRSGAAGGDGGAGGEKASGIASSDSSHMLLRRATSVLREEYMLKQNNVKQAIVKRVHLIQEQKQAQIDDVRKLRYLQ